MNDVIVDDDRGVLDDVTVDGIIILKSTSLW